MASALSNNFLPGRFEAIIQKRMESFADQVKELDLSFEVIDRITQLAKNIFENDLSAQMMNEAVSEFLAVGKVTDTPALKLLLFEKSKEFESVRETSLTAALKFRKELCGYVQTNLGEKSERAMKIITAQFTSG